MAFQLVLDEFGSSAEVLGIAFANTAIASCFLVALASCAMRLRGWNASNRYCAWSLVLALMLLLPAVQLASRPAEPPLPAVIRGAHSSWTYVAQSEETAPVVVLQPQRKDLVTAPPQHGVWRGFSFRVPATLILLLAYCCGVLLGLARLACGLLASLRLKKDAAPATDPQLLRIFSDAAERARLRRPVSVAISPVVKSPVLVGYWKPAILLPDAIVEQLQPEELEQVFSHEFAHAARYDDWAVAFERVLQAILFFHPLIRFVCWRIDVNREISCDDRVIASVQPARYAACLTRIAELSGYAPQVTGTLPLLSRKSNLVSRVEAILDRTRSHLTPFSARRLLCFACCGVAAGVIGLRSPALMAYPPNPQPLIVLPSATPSLVPRADAAQAAEAPTGHKEQKIAPPAEQREAKRSAEKQSYNSVSSIEVTSEDGSTSSVDVHGGFDRRTNSALPPGSIIFRRDGQSYIIRDPATIAGAEDLIRPLDQLGRSQIDLARQQEQMAKAQQKLREEIDATVKRSLDPETIKKLGEMQGRVQEKLWSLQAKDWEKQRKDLDELARNMASKFADQHGEFAELQQKLNREMGQLQLQLAPLGRMQGKMFEQLTPENRELQKKLQDLVDRAEKNGLAHPLK